MKTDTELREVCEALIETIVEQSNNDPRAVLSLLINTTINTLSYTEMCPHCYEEAIVDAIKRTAKGKAEELKHFSFDENEVSVTHFGNKVTH